MPATPHENAPAFAVEIRAIQSAEDLAAFRTLNEEWITRFFVLEEADRRALGDPQAAILAKGGQIFIAARGEESIGCVALVPMGDGVFELSKMAVAPELRGQGIGRRLLLYAIDQAMRMGASSLFLGSSTKLPNAVGLYESAGFQHVPPERLPALPYTRADVFMELPL
jgi:putative acetyltransferase